MSDDDRARVGDVLRGNERFVIASHEDPDGDSLGSSLALALGLEKLGKSADVVVSDAVPEGLTWLPEVDRVRAVERLPDGDAVAILVECSDFERSGLDGYAGRLCVNVDHHTKNARYADVNWIDARVAATGVMIHWLLEDLGVEVDSTMANLLYVALLTDTGSFQHSNADAGAFRAAAELVAAGADPEWAARCAYRQRVPEQLRLLGAALGSLELEQGNRVATLTLTPEDFRDVGGFADTEGIINHAQAISGVRVAVLLKQFEAGAVRISLRSDGTVDVAELAASHGGGGHPRAAGFRLDGSLEEARSRVLAEVRARLDRGHDS